jgi:hypothetical protein
MTHTIASFCITPDGTVLQSYHRHDYKTYTDANGEEYMIDGGCDYIRHNVNKEPAEYFTVTTDDTHKMQREWFNWGTRGKSGKTPLKWVALQDLDKDHIEAILDTQHQIQPHIRKLFEDELQFRKQASTPHEL